ncbi:MAG: dephospho-CoA kinase [Cytophagaceae bacterium SCN 52-12]|nr:MAG: dephospho-CoA kinase [Cytophagaceae bacterium SCN 52-12]
MALRVGVTGGIGSGKSIVCRVFAAMGVPVYYADERAKWLIEHHPGIREEISALLGAEAYTAGGKYNTAFVSARVFPDRQLLDRLNAIVHPRVKEDTAQWMEKHAERPYVVKEAAIMKKAGEESGLDFVIAVVAPEALRIERVLSRDPQRTREQVRSIIDSQASEAELAAMADFVINNDETEPVIPQVLKIHRHLSSPGQST